MIVARVARMTFRAFVLALAPPWGRRAPLNGATDDPSIVGSKLLWTFGLVMDGLFETMEQGIVARFPGKGTPTALGLIGRDRRILRGIVEPDAHYALRLNEWLDCWRRAGNAFAILQQAIGYLAPSPVTVMRTVDARSNWNTRTGSGDESFGRNEEWDWDGDFDRWARFWLIVYNEGRWDTNDAWGSTCWGGAWGATGYVWGAFNVPAAQITDLRRIVATWKAAGVLCEHIIVAEDPNVDLVPDGSGPYYPNGQWGRDKYRPSVYSFIPGRA